MNPRKALLAALLIAFVLTGGFGILFGMGISPSNQMSDCPFMGVVAICQMSPFEHVSEWKNTFVAIPASSFLGVLFLLFGLVVFSRSQQLPRLLSPSPQLVGISRDPEVALHNPLRRFIARGLMHPKIF